jgi:ornithine carbamoyltransferase
MAVKLKGRSFVSIHDYSVEEIHEILKTAELLKLQSYRREPHHILPGRILGMIFQKPSLRTRVSFEVGIMQLGGQALYLSPEEIKLGQRETTEDVAKVLSRYVDAIMARTFAHQTILDLAKYATVPVINGLSDFNHPCQILADLMTVQEKQGKLAGLKVIFVGDGNNVANSWAYGAAKTGIHLIVASPKGYELSEKVMREANDDARETGGSINISNDPQKSCENADVIVTDVWTSMGQEGEKAERLARFNGFAVTMELLDKAKRSVSVLHCLPAHYGEEIQYEVSIDRRSAIFDQAENRLHAQKGLMALIIP